MRHRDRFGARITRMLLVLALLAITTAGSARAQEDFYGWYGPYEDGCFYWWDGYQWTGDVDCNGDGYTDAPQTTYPAGWYGPHDDGCNHWWDGYQWTLDVDCDFDGLTDNATFPAGWYGPFENECNYWWDGSQYTGQFDCDGDGQADAVEETYPPGFYDPYGDGCLYWFDGTRYTGETDCNGDGSIDRQQRPDDIDTRSSDDFIDTQVDGVNRMWADRFASEGLPYTNAALVVATEPITVGCFTGDGDQLLETDDWIFYCSRDETIYLAPGNLDRIVQSGIGAVQMLVAHEIGHHVQAKLDPNFDTTYGTDTVKYENQATCMAGVWFNRLDAEGSPSDLASAMTFLGTATDAVHGTGDDQIAALLKGYHDPGAC